jgi:hypothetical protein
MMRVASQHNIKICRILFTYQDYVDVCSKDMATLAPHLSQHAKGVREEERLWLEECRKSVRGNDREPGHEEPHKLRGSMKSRKEPVTPRVGNNRVHHHLGSTNPICEEEGRLTAAVCGLPSSQSSHGEEPISCLTDLGYSPQDLQSSYHLIQNKEGDEYKPRFAPSTGSSSSLICRSD